MHVQSNMSSRLRVLCLSLPLPICIFALVKLQLVKLDLAGRPSGNVGIVPIPHIPYPDERTFSDLRPREVKVSGSGGWEAKFEVTLEDRPSSDRFMYKPSHGIISVPGGWMFRAEKGGFYYEEERELPALILNELIAYIVDQILGLGRVPPVVPFEIEITKIQQALHDQMKHKNKHLRSKMNMKSDTWNDWLQNKDSKIVGTLQYMLLDVKHPLKRLFHLRQAFQGGFYRREINTRTFYDYLIANFDRGNNNFLHPASEEGLPPALVYIDQNYLSDENPKQFNYKFPFRHNATLDVCQFYWQPVSRLRYLSEISEVVMDHLRAYETVSRLMSKKVFEEDDLIPLRNMNHRRQILLDFVDECIDLHGFDHVFGQ